MTSPVVAAISAEVVVGWIVAFIGSLILIMLAVISYLWRQREMSNDSRHEDFVLMSNNRHTDMMRKFDKLDTKFNELTEMRYRCQVELNEKFADKRDTETKFGRLYAAVEDLPDKFRERFSDRVDTHEKIVRLFSVTDDHDERIYEIECKLGRAAVESGSGQRSGRRRTRDDSDCNEGCAV